jgi:hypothetical protein
MAADSTQAHVLPDGRRGWWPVVAAVLGSACAGASDNDKVAGYTYCTRDADCPGGQVCDQDDTEDSYCTPRCTDDESCPTQVGCPSLSPVGKQCWIEQQLEAEERGVCDQFQGYYGPNSCRAAEADENACIPNGNACGPSDSYVDACCSGYCGETGTCRS